jgi:broad-specificity NMP kinase
MFGAIKNLWVNFLSIFKSEAKETVKETIKVSVTEVQAKVSEVSDMINKASYDLTEK